MTKTETRRVITINLLSRGVWRSLLLAVLLLAIVRRSLELGILANVNALGGSILSLTILALINAAFGFGLGLAAGTYLTKAKRQAQLLAWACGLYAVLLCAATLASSLPLFLLLVGAATGLGVFVNAGETMIETGFLEGKDEIIVANSLRGAALQSLQLIAPLVAGTLLSLLAPPKLILLAAVVMIIPLTIFARLPAKNQNSASTAKENETLPDALRAIYGLLVNERELQIFFAVQTIVMVVLGMQGPLIFTYFVEERGFDATQFGFLMAALGAGALLSAGIFIWTNMRPSLVLIMSLLILDGVALLGLVFSTGPASLSFFMAMMGLIGGVYMIVMRSFLQSHPSATERDKLIAVFYGVQEPLLMFGLVLLLLILPFFSASQILLGAALVEVFSSGLLLYVVLRKFVPT